MQGGHGSHDESVLVPDDEASAQEPEDFDTPNPYESADFDGEQDDAWLEGYSDD